MKIIKQSPTNKSEFLLAPRHPESGAEFSVNLLRLLSDGASDFYTEIVPIAEITAIQKKSQNFTKFRCFRLLSTTGMGQRLTRFFTFKGNRIMKMTESISEPASFLTKEVGRIVFSEVTKEDLPEIFNAMANIFTTRRKCKLWICSGSHDFWFDNDKEAGLFMRTFRFVIETIDEDCFDGIGRARKLSN
jgi:hypothetical protein